MNIRVKRVTAIAIILLMPYLASCKKTDEGVSLSEGDTLYGVTKEKEEKLETKETTEYVEKFEEFEGYLKEDISNEDFEENKYQKVNVLEKEGNKYLIENNTYSSCYVDSEKVEKLPESYIEVDISDQNLKLYNEGEEVLNTDVVTGKNSTPTDLGYFSIAYKDYDVTLRGSNGDGTDYASHVDYWMPFNGGEGFHDATWRDSFGGDIYEYDGSHGCVNMPYSEAEELYNNVETGTKVLIHK